MILELAILTIKPDSNAAFEEKLDQAQSIISKAEGYLGHQFQKCLERENRYILLIRWATLEAHTEGFRNSELFAEWRGLIGPHFEKPPEVEHYEMKFENA